MKWEDNCSQELAAQSDPRGALGYGKQGLSTNKEGGHHGPISEVAVQPPFYRKSECTTALYCIWGYRRILICFQMNAMRCSQCGVLATGSVAEEPFDNFDLTVPASGTRHHKLLNSNEPPEETELNFVHSTISASDARLSSLENQISTLRDQLQQLETEHNALLSYRAQNHAILTPIRRIPPEVLGEIFSWTLPSVQARDGRVQMTDSPWVLTHTSRYWRKVCISTPSLWSLVVIVYFPGLDPTAWYPSSMIETQIARAH